MEPPPSPRNGMAPPPSPFLPPIPTRPSNRIVTDTKAASIVTVSSTDTRAVTTAPMKTLHDAAKALSSAPPAKASRCSKITTTCKSCTMQQKHYLPHHLKKLHDAAKAIPTSPSSPAPIKFQNIIIQLQTSIQKAIQQNPSLQYDQWYKTYFDIWIGEGLLDCIDDLDALEAITCWPRPPQRTPTYGGIFLNIKIIILLKYLSPSSPSTTLKTLPTTHYYPTPILLHGVLDVPSNFDKEVEEAREEYKSSMSPTSKDTTPPTLSSNVNANKNATFDDDDPSHQILHLSSTTFSSPSSHFLSKSNKNTNFDDDDPSHNHHHTTPNKHPYARYHPYSNHAIYSCTSHHSIYTDDPSYIQTKYHPSLQSNKHATFDDDDPPSSNTNFDDDEPPSMAYHQYRNYDIYSWKGKPQKKPPHDTTISSPTDSSSYAPETSSTTSSTVKLNNSPRRHSINHEHTPPSYIKVMKASNYIFTNNFTFPTVNNQNANFDNDDPSYNSKESEVYDNDDPSSSSFKNSNFDNDDHTSNSHPLSSNDENSTFEDDDPSISLYHSDSDKYSIGDASDDY